MAGLGGRVHDDVGAHLLDQGQHARAVTDVELVVGEAGDLLGQARLVPAGVTLRTKEDGTLVVVDAMDRQARLLVEVHGDLRADQPRGTGDKTTLHR